MHERAQKYLDDPSLVRAIVADGCERARKLAEETMRDVRDAMGLELHVMANDAEAPVIDLAQAAGAPVAKVYGQPMLALPQDLYIPPEALEIFLESFEGPLDLLLYLIRKQNINVLDIPMAELTRQYLGYVEMMRRTQLELAAEYLLMAAVLIEIKSRLLLPKPPAAGPGACGPARRACSAAARVRADEGGCARRSTSYRSSSGTMRWCASGSSASRARDCPTSTPDDLKAAWAGLVARARVNRHHLVTREQLSVRSQMSRLLKLLEPGTSSNSRHCLTGEQTSRSWS